MLTIADEGGGRVSQKLNIAEEGGGGVSQMLTRGDGGLKNFNKGF